MTEPVRTEKRNSIKYLLAVAITKKLWVAGYITDAERKRIDERNKALLPASS
jgi:hypothetical protein